MECQGQVGGELYLEHIIWAIYNETQDTGM